MSVNYQELADDWYSNHRSYGYDHDHFLLNDIETLYSFYKWAVDHNCKELSDYLEMAQMVYWMKKVSLRMSALV